VSKRSLRREPSSKGAGGVDDSAGFRGGGKLDGGSDARAIGSSSCVAAKLEASVRRGWVPL
jgi:hypothetical protein